MVDEVSKKKGKKLLLCASFSESHYVSGFLKHYLKINAGPDERLKYQGINVADWVKKRLLRHYHARGTQYRKVC